MAFVLILLGILAVVGLSIVLGLIRGFVLSYLWQWFAVPFGLPEISVIHAWGLSMLVALLTYETPYQGPAEEAKYKLIGHILSPFVLLLAGYILSHYM